MRTTLLLVFLGSFFGVKAQTHPQAGARSYGLANTSLCLNDVWSVYNNPGALGELEQTSIGLAAENRFLMKELSGQSLAFGFHTEKSGNFGLSFQQYGYSLYREMNGGLAYGMKLFDQFSAGVSINYHGIFLAENYGSKSTVSASLGILYKPLKNLQLGMRVQNLNRTRLAEFNDERLPTNLSLGMFYQLSKKVGCTLEAEKDLIHPLNIKGAVEIQAHEILALRLGANSYPFITTFGLGLKLKSFQLDAAAQWHTVLGLNPSFGLHYSFN